MYNENDFEYIDLDEESNIDLKMQLETIITDEFLGDSRFIMDGCWSCKTESKIFYCYFETGEEEEDEYLVKIDLNNNTVEEIDDEELKEIIFNC